MEDMRAAALAGLKSAGIAVLRAEDFDVSPTTPRGTCLQGVKEADIFVMLLGRRYGDIQESGLSATEEEFQRAKELGKDIYVFVVSPDADDAQSRFRDRLIAWQGGCFVGKCSSPTELQGEVARIAFGWASKPDTGHIDHAVAENRQLAEQRTSGHSWGQRPWLALSWSGERLIHVDEDAFYGSIGEDIGDLFVSGRNRLSNHRPRLSYSGSRLTIDVEGRHQNEHTIRASITMDGQISVGTLISPRPEDHIHNVLHSIYYLPPSLLEDRFARCAAVIRGSLDVLDPDRILHSGRFQCSLSGVQNMYIEEPPSSRGSVTIPGMLGSRESGLLVVPTKPETVFRSQLGDGSDLPKKYVRRLQRMLESTRGS